MTGFLRDRLSVTNRFLIRTVAVGLAGLFSIAVPAEISFAMVGDIMAGSDHPSRNSLPSRPAELFLPVKPILSAADVAIGNMESGMAGPEVKPPYKGKNSYSFRMPLSTAGLFRDAGFDVMNLANNHSYDCGGAGVVQATNALTRAGIAFTGMAGAGAAVLDVRGVKVGVLGFSTYGVHNSLLDPDNSRKLITHWAGQVDILVVTYHGGAEGEKALHVPRKDEFYYRENRGDVFRFSRAAVDAGADLVFGHGPHVLRGMEIYKERLIAYSLGNFMGQKLFNVSGYLGISAILEAVVDEKGKILRGKITPLLLQSDGPTLPDPEKKALALVKRLSAEDFPGTGILLNEEGSFPGAK